MRILLLAGLAAGAMSLLSPTFAQKMGRDYYENATSTCRVHVWMRTSGRPEPAMTVTPINGGQNLKKEDLQDRMDAYRKLYSVDVPAHKARAEMMAKVESDLKRRTVYEEYMNNAGMLLDAARRNPAMGMTIEQVESSKWGLPDLRRKMPRGDEVLDVLCYRWGRCLVFRRGLLVEVLP